MPATGTTARKTPSHVGIPPREQRGGQYHRSAFPTTHWSLIEGLGSSEHRPNPELLDRFFRAYAPALDVFVRMAFGTAYDDAGRADLIQDFIVCKCLEGNLFSRADRKSGRLRALLCKSLANFARSDLRKRGRGNSRQYRDQFAVDERERYAETDVSSGVDVFDVAWACQLIARTVKDYRFDCESRNETRLWRVFEVMWLKPLIERREKPKIKQAAEELEMSATAVHGKAQRSNAEFSWRLRRMLGEYLNEASELQRETAALIRAVELAPNTMLLEILDVASDDLLG